MIDKQEKGMKEEPRNTSCTHGNSILDGVDIVEQRGKNGIYSIHSAGKIAYLTKKIRNLVRTSHLYKDKFQVD